MPSLDVVLTGYNVRWELIVGFVVGALIVWGLRRAQKATPAVESGDRVLHCPRVLSGLTLVIVLLFGGLFSVAVAVVDVDGPKDAAVIAVLGLIALGAAGIAWTLYKSRVRWNETDIVRESAWHKPRHCAWDEITEVRYTTISGAFQIRAANGTRFKVPLHYTGVASFVDSIKQRVPPERYEAARAGIERIRAGKL